jgi:hypothetical protein
MIALLFVVFVVAACRSLDLSSGGIRRPSKQWTLLVGSSSVTFGVDQKHGHAKHVWIQKMIAPIFFITVRTVLALLLPGLIGI